MSIKKRSKVATIVAAFALLVLIAVLALPSLAAPGGAKNFSFAQTAGPVNAGTTGQSFSVLITNTSPTGSSSNISSARITVPSQFTNITNLAIGANSTNTDSSVVLSVDSTNASCQGGTAQTINVCSLDPTKRTQKVEITFKADVSNTVACGDTNSGAWAVTANTGSQNNGDSFTQKPANLSPYTVIHKTCNATIAGTVWHDRNNNGARDASEGESGLGSWVVEAFNAQGFVASATTANDGSYSITNLPSGVNYTVCEFAPPEDAGFGYRGWFQSSPGSATSCSGLSGNEPTGYTVQQNGNSVAPLPSSGASGVDFFNVRIVTVSCDSGTDQTYTVGGNGDPLSSITISAANCKAGKFVFESWVKPDGTQETDFYPTVSSGSSQPATQTVAWALSSKSQSTLTYDDNLGFGFRQVLFCNTDAQGNFQSMPTGQQTGASTCLMNTTENASQGGVNRTDTIVTMVDGKLTLSK
jgi:hypothetical protein